ncbi:uncharacterized protein LOC110437540 [Sorghum bicolor]|uniref:uncharacterized protein LOC110437540 n=1 Tax=Sorghum bicolor TaxID=4558 RepID=UPI000B426956|nr:uncharacterized protein LOC110437540 [Sorghum bicolor]|eukprot:XP_021321686.1 uncharacterized protein LOC110437540 [Sorghum bicolor]
MSQASSSTGLNRRSSTGRNVVQAQPLAVVAAGSMATGFDPEAVTDNATGLPLIFCPDCNDMRVFSAITKLGVNEGRRYFKCPRKTHVNPRCMRYWFEEEYVVYLHDNGYLSSASSTTEVPEVVGRLDSLEKNLKSMEDKVGKNRDGMGNCICLVCGCVNVTLFLVLAICVVVAVVFK